MPVTQNVLLFGMPRSGTTWIGKIFDSHPETLYRHEPDSQVIDKTYPLLISMDCGDQLERKTTSKLEEWFANTAEKVVASRPFFKKNYMSGAQYWLFVATAYGCKAAERYGIPWFKSPLMWQNSKSDIRLTFKSVESVGRIGKIAQLTDAKAIQIVRHPCGHVDSTFTGSKNNNFDGIGAIWEDWELFDKLIRESGDTRFRLEDVKSMAPEERLTLRWGLVNDFAYKQLQQVGGHLLNYESLCREPFDVTRTLFEFAGMTVTSSTEAFLKESTETSDDAYYSIKKTPLQAAYKWKDKLTEKQIENIKEVALKFETGKMYADDF